MLEGNVVFLEFIQFLFQFPYLRMQVDLCDSEHILVTPLFVEMELLSLPPMFTAMDEKAVPLRLIFLAS